MKRLIQSSLMMGVAILAMISCKKENHTLNTNVSAVAALTAPADQANLNLTPGGPGIVFQWDASTTPDLVLYEVAFDKADGDFSKPVYKVLSDGSGVQAQATIPQDTLNKIASIAGIASLSSGTLKWTVITSLATNIKISTSSRTLAVTRPAGFAVAPKALYITGTATEGGTDIAKAVPFKPLASGTFEVYTSLKPGSYQFNDKADGTGTKYYLDDKGVIQQGDGTTTVTAASAVYRMYLDFNVATSKIVSIDAVGLYMSAYNTEIGQLSYIGNGTWEVAKLPVTFYQFSWGRDQRYKFILHTSDGLEYWGSTNQNNVDPEGQGPEYYYLVPVTSDQWNNTYKFPAAADTHNVKVDLYFQAANPYTHTVAAFN